MKLSVNDANGVNLAVNDNNNIGLRAGDTINIGTSDYNDLVNKPTVEGTTLQGDLTLEDLKAYTRAQIDALLAYKANLADLATVATTGDYDDLINAPELASVATSGDYNDLSNNPVNVSAFINDAGYLTEELEPMFNGSDAANITAENIESWDNKAEGVQDLGYIDSEEYEDDRDVFLNTLLNDGVYRFIWGDGDDFEYYVVVESMLDEGNGFVYQKYWYSEEGSRYLYNCSLTLEDGEVVDRSEDNYITLSDAIGTFATKSHGHFESKNDNMSVFDWCDTNDLTFDNTKPFIIYTDTLNSKNWIIERYTTPRTPNYRFIRVYDMSDASHFYIRSGSYVGSTITWGNWVTWYNTDSDENVKQTAPNPSNYSYWRPLMIGDSSSATEGFTPTDKTSGAFAFKTLEAQPSTGTIRMGVASMFKGSYTSKLSPDELTENRTVTIPDASGTMALTDDIPTKTSDIVNDSLYARGKIAIFNGTCSTGAATAEKGVTCNDFTAADLVAGAMILVTFSETNSAAVADLKLNVNSTGAYPIKQNGSGTMGNLGGAAYLKTGVTYPFIFNGDYWVTWYNTDTNTIGYNIRTNSLSLPMKSITYRYRILFTSADGTSYVPANNSSSTSATASKTVCQDKIDPHGRIVYYATTASVAAGSRPSITYQYAQYYTITLGYSFNRTGSALTMTAWTPVYVKCTPQADGSAIMDSATPIVQALPTTNDGSIYIFLGVAISATAIEMTLEHPVYYHDGTALRLWTGPVS